MVFVMGSYQEDKGLLLSRITQFNHAVFVDFPRLSLRTTVSFTCFYLTRELQILINGKLQLIHVGMSARVKTVLLLLDRPDCYSKFFDMGVVIL